MHTMGRGRAKLALFMRAKQNVSLMHLLCGFYAQEMLPQLVRTSVE